MGAIQNELNQLLGTSALVAGGAKKMKLDKLHATQEALEKDPALAKESKELEGKIEKDKKDIETLKKGQIPIGDGLSNAFDLGVYGPEDYKREIQKRELSIAELEGRREAISIQRKEFAKLIGGKK